MQKYGYFSILQFFSPLRPPNPPTAYTDLGGEGGSLYTQNRSAERKLICWCGLEHE